MRCSCCDRNLNDYESTIRYAESGEFADLCNRCRTTMDGVKFFSRRDLEPNSLSPQDVEDYEENEDDETP